MREGEAATSRRRGVTRNDVARAAGVSNAVVSYVVNGGPKVVSEATAARVRDAVARLGYRPNRTARALASGRSRTLGLVVPDSTNPFFAEFTVAIQAAATDNGYAVLMVNAGADPQIDLTTVLDLCDRQIDALIMARWTATGLLRELDRRAVVMPVVLFDSAAPLPGYSTVGPDSADGTIAAVDHLLHDHGHPNVALVIGDSADAAIDGREIGWRQAHDRSGRPVGTVIRAPFDRQGGYTAGRQLLQQAARPTAIITGSDLQAVGVLRAAHELAVAVPEDLAVISFDGTAETEYAWPALTAVRQPITAMAKAAVTAALQPAPDGRHEVFTTVLIRRASCGCHHDA